jgi:hypothetical protein
MAPGAVEFGPLAQYFADRIILIEARTSMVCPNASYNIRKFSYGSLFLLILVGIFVVYVPLGLVIGWVRKGVIDFPNAEFWSAVSGSIAFAVTYACTTGRRRGDNKQILDYHLVGNG